MRPCNCLDDAVGSVGPFHGVMHGHPEKPANIVAMQHVNEAIDVFPGDTGPRRVMHQHPVGTIGTRGQDLQRIQHRVAALDTAVDPHQVGMPRELGSPPPAVVFTQ